MKSANSSTSHPSPSPIAKPVISTVSARLTNSEVEQLRQDKKESADYALRAFSSTPKTKPKVA